MIQKSYLSTGSFYPKELTVPRTTIVVRDGTKSKLRNEFKSIIMIEFSVY